VTLAANTVTPRAPLNIFEVTRKNLAGDGLWANLVVVPHYYIPENGPVPAKTVNTSAIVTGLIITNRHTATIRASAKILSNGGEYFIIKDASVPPRDFLSVGFQRQILLSGEVMQASSTIGPADVHFTYIVNQREEFEDNTP